MLFRSVLLNDAEGILTQQGENTQSSRVIKFTDAKDIIKLKTVIKAYIFEAVEIENAGLKVELKKTEEYVMPEELITTLNKENSVFIFREDINKDLKNLITF